MINLTLHVNNQLSLRSSGIGIVINARDVSLNMLKRIIILFMGPKQIRLKIADEIIQIKNKHNNKYDPNINFFLS